MKMNRLNPLLFLIAFMVSFGFAACGGDDDNNKEEPVDTEDPGIALTAPKDGDDYVRGVEIFSVSGNLTDNAALDTCTFSLSPNLKSASLKSIDDPQVWRPNAKGYSLSGKEKAFSGEKVFGDIPNDAMAGTYTLTVEVGDVAGNTVTQNISFTISAE